MKKQLLGFLLGVMLVFGCVGCGAENTTIKPTATVTETTTEESTPEQTEEATATTEETTAPTPEAKEEPSEETTVETEPETTEPEETVESEPTEEPTSEPQATYTYTDMSATMYAQQTVNVRDLPDTSGSKLGSLSTNDEIQISGQCNETGWYRFEYNGSTAFVSNKYVGENKVEVQTASSSSTTSTTSGKKNWYDYYSDHVWYEGDNGMYMFIIVDDYQDGFDTDYSYPTSVLNERFPGEFVYLRLACELCDGHWMFFAYVRPEAWSLSQFSEQFR